MAKRNPPLPKIKLEKLEKGTLSLWDSKTNTITIGEGTNNKTVPLLHEIGHWSFQHGRGKQKKFSLEEIIEYEVEAEVFAYNHGGLYAGSQKHWGALIDDTFDTFDLLEMDISREGIRKLILKALRKKKAPKKWIERVQGLKEIIIRVEKELKEEKDK